MNRFFTFVAAGSLAVLWAGPAFAQQGEHLPGQEGQTQDRPTGGQDDSPRGTIQSPLVGDKTVQEAKMSERTQLMNPNDAGFIVRLPDPNAEVWFQDYKTQQRGSMRQYETAALDPNRTYTFVIRARWMRNGQQMEQTRQVQGRAGQNITVDFTTQSREQTPTNPRTDNPGNTQQPSNALPNPTQGNQPATPAPTPKIPTEPRNQQGSPLNPPR
jgi:uncharacterized protein (TIGR03000 family)